jgi:hypothetical protein
VEKTVLSLSRRLLGADPRGTHRPRWLSLGGRLEQHKRADLLRNCRYAPDNATIDLASRRDVDARSHVQASHDAADVVRCCDGAMLTAPRARRVYLPSFTIHVGHSERTSSLACEMCGGGRHEIVDSKARADRHQSPKVSTCCGARWIQQQTFSGQPSAQPPCFIGLNGLHASRLRCGRPTSGPFPFSFYMRSIRGNDCLHIGTALPGSRALGPLWFRRSCASNSNDDDFACVVSSPWTAGLAGRRRSGFPCSVCVPHR